MKGFRNRRCYAVRANLPPMKRPCGLILGILIAAGAATGALADPGAAAVAIASRASADYVRAQLPNGTFLPETFSFGKGGVWRGAERDPTIDAMDFMEIARTVAAPLAGQSYVPCRDPKATKLLIMVYWGTTRAPEHATDSIASQNLAAASAAAMAASGALQVARFRPQDSMAPTQMTQSSTPGYSVNSPEMVDMDNAFSGAMAMVAAEDRDRDLLDALNASMLGYDSEWDKAVSYKGTPLEFRRRDIVDELEHQRYFVVLMAYDFQMMWKKKKAKLLWETRFSIREQGNDFSKQLAAMTQNAAGYFGRNSGGLVRKEIPEGHVDIGEQKVLDYAAPK
jgi:hypothetical protein